jgi:malate permease and related proteins
VLLITLLIIASVGIGIGAERRDRERAQAASRRALDLLLYILLPIVVLTNVGRVHLTTGVAAGLGLAYVTVITVSVLAWLLTRRMGLSRPVAGASIVSTMVVNTGYLGIPLAGALLGRSAVPTAVAYDLVVSLPVLYIGGFGVGASMGTESGDSASERLRAFLTRNLALPAAVIGLLLPASVLTDGVVDASHVLLLLIAPLGFFALGVTLTGESEHGDLELPPRITAPVVSAVVLRNVVAPLLLLGLSTLIVDVPDAYLLAAAMPCGLNALTVAHGYGLDRRTVASAVAWSTVIVLIGAGVVALVT